MFFRDRHLLFGRFAILYHMEKVVKMQFVTKKPQFVLATLLFVVSFVQLA